MARNGHRLRSAHTAGGVRARIVEPDPSGMPSVKLWGLSPYERSRRILRRSGLEPQRRGQDRCAPLEGVDRGEQTIAIRSDYVIDERLISALLTRPDSLLVDGAPGALESAAPIAVHASGQKLDAALQMLRRGSLGPRDPELQGLQIVFPDELVPSYDAALRKDARPLVVPLIPGREREIEAKLFDASYKGITDLVTRWVWPVPARAVTRHLVELGIPPNAVTALSWVEVALATILFARGAYTLGLAFAWAMTFLDTVDGKLARVTLSSSRFGTVFDHSLDLIHPPFWYLAWALGMGNTELSGIVVWVCVVGYVVGRAIEGLFLLVFHFEIHCWQPIDARMRLVTARRNPNLILLTLGTLGGRPDLGLSAVAIWTVTSIAFHSIRLVQAFALRQAGHAIQAGATRRQGLR